MKVDSPSLADIPRHELIRAALDLGIERPERLSPEDLRRQVRLASVEAKPQSGETKSSTGLFAVARNLLASVVERGLNLPDAARAIRETVRPSPRHRPPLPTVTLAQIYLAQGYPDRAKRTLEHVLEREPDNYKALELYERFAASSGATPASSDTTAEGSVNDPHRGEADAVRGESEAAPHSEPPVPSTRTSVTPGVAPPSQLWGERSQLLAAPRDALVLIEREAHVGRSEVQLYWELGPSNRRLFDRDAHAFELDVAFFSPGNPTPRRLSLSVRSAVGWADVEIVPREVVRACLRRTGSESVVLAVGLNVRAPESEGEAAETYRPRPRAYYADVIERARHA